MPTLAAHHLVAATDPYYQGGRVAAVIVLALIVALFIRSKITKRR